MNGDHNQLFFTDSLNIFYTLANLLHPPCSDSVFLSAAEALADLVTPDDLAVGRLYPPLDNIREISVKIATKVATEAYQEGTASTYPEPEDKEALVRSFLYDYNYDNYKALPTLYGWPESVQQPFWTKE